MSIHILVACDEAKKLDKHTWFTHVVTAAAAAGR